MKSNNNWQIQNLKDICTSIIRGPFGSSLKKEFFITKNSMSYKVYEQKNAIHSNAFIGTYYISKDKFQKLKRFEVKANDIIMSCSGTIGKLYTIPENAESGIINQALLKFTLNNKLITNSFFLYYLKTIVDNIEKKGSGIQNIGSVNLIKKLKIPIPPIYIQEQIVKELDTLCDIITKKKEQLAELDKLAQATFYDMFGDPLKNEKYWETEKLENICSSIVRGPFGSTLKKDFFVQKSEFTYKVYEQKHAIQKDAFIGQYYIDELLYKSLKRFTVLPKDIIMSCSGTIGEFFEIPANAERGIINQALLKFTLLENKIINIFFLFLMKQLIINVEKKGSGIQNIGSVKFIKDITLGLPPISLQNQFAEKIKAIDQKKSLINQLITDVQLLFDYTMDKYFN